jgi:formylglycine-generating enzyme required for sulfatase activity
VSKPATLLGARFENLHLADDIARRGAEESSKDAGALPLLSYLLDDMWKSKEPKWDSVLRLPGPAIDLGRVLGDRANAFIATHPRSEDALRRIFTLKLATVREDGEPTRRRAFRSEFSDDEWRLISELADHPNRLLITAARGAAATPAPAVISPDSPAGGETYAEVAHEAIFRRWETLREWIAAEREFLAWRSGLEAARRAWAATPDRSKNDALLMGLPFAQAKNWLTKRREDLSVADQRFIDQSAKAEQRRRRRTRALIGAVAAAIVASLVAWVKHDDLSALWHYVTVIRPFISSNILPYALKLQAEQALKSGDTFRECVPRRENADYCPDMVVVPAGTFAMGSLQTDKKASKDELPQHQVTIAERFAVSKFELTFAEWDACVDGGGCRGYKPPDAGWGRGDKPVINVNWDDAKAYAAWLSQVTGKTYRLLTEAEYEYAARAGTTTEYPWGDDVGENNANCDGCGSKWDNQQTAPVGSFPPNKFGLDDMVGNVFEWTEDCYHPSYEIDAPQGKVDAPTDGSAWTSGYCSNRIIRGGSWVVSPSDIRSATRGLLTSAARAALSFRVARTLAAGAGAKKVTPVRAKDLGPSRRSTVGAESEYDPMATPGSDKRRKFIQP